MSFTMTFGKYEGHDISNVDNGYLNWLAHTFEDDEIFSDAVLAEAQNRGFTDLDELDEAIKQEIRERRAMEGRKVWYDS